MQIAADGVAAAAEWHPSPNFSPRPAGAEIVLVVLHCISLPPGKFGGDAVARFFCNKLDFSAAPFYANLRGLQVAAHFFIRRGGELLQFVACQNAAWHAGESAWRGRAQCNDFSIGVELEGTDKTPFAAPQYKTLFALLAALAAQYPKLQIAGHSHIALPAGRKTDPGEHFNWDAVFAAVGKERDGRENS